MCKYAGVLFLLSLPAVLSLPAKDDLMLDLGDDTAVVESTVREARAAVPEHIEDLLEPGVKQAYLHTYGDKENDDGDEQGYHKKTQDKGSDGYKHFDSYHKKDGDKFGYEVHSEYGKAGKGGAEGSGKSGKYSEGYSNKDDEAESKKSYQVVENAEDQKKKGVSAVEDYDGDSGYYADSGDAEVYTEGEVENYGEGEGDSGAYTEGSEGGYDEGDGDSGYYAAEDGDNESYGEYEEGEPEAEEYDY